MRPLHTIVNLYLVLVNRVLFDIFVSKQLVFFLYVYPLYTYRKA